MDVKGDNEDGSCDGIWAGVGNDAFSDDEGSGVGMEMDARFCSPSVECGFVADIPLLADIFGVVLLCKALVDAPLGPFAGARVPVRAAVGGTPSFPEGYDFDCNPDQKESYVRDVELKSNISFVVSDVLLCPPSGFLIFEVDAVEGAVLVAPAWVVDCGCDGTEDVGFMSSVEADEEDAVFCEAR